MQFADIPKWIMAFLLLTVLTWSERFASADTALEAEIVVAVPFDPDPVAIKREAIAGVVLRPDNYDVPMFLELYWMDPEPIEGYFSIDEVWWEDSPGVGHHPDGGGGVHLIDMTSDMGVWVAAAFDSGAYWHVVMKYEDLGFWGPRWISGVDPPWDGTWEFYSGTVEPVDLPVTAVKATFAVDTANGYSWTISAKPPAGAPANVDPKFGAGLTFPWSAKLFHSTRFTITTVPAGYEGYVFGRINSANTGVAGRTYPPDPGTITYDGWVNYEPFTEPSTEKHPLTVVVKVAPTFGGDVAGDEVSIRVEPIFKSLKDNFGEIYAMGFAQWKYAIDISNLHSIAYDSTLPSTRLGITLPSIGNVYRYAHLGPSGLDDENVCASTLGHENAHAGDTWTVFLFGSKKVAEENPYKWEFTHIPTTGITDPHKTFVEDAVRYIDDTTGTVPDPGI